MSHQPVGVPCSCNERGWMPGVEHVPIQWPMKAANRATDMQPAVIVDHIMDGFLNTIVSWASDGASKVIVHFGVSVSGRIVQFHPIFSPGIHATARVIGPHTAAIVRTRAGSPNAYAIGIEHEGLPLPKAGVNPKFVWSSENPWPDAMVAASVRVKRWCFDTAPSLGLPSRETLIGHYENGDPNRVNDPAAEADRSVWPIDRMLRELNTARVAVITLTTKQRELLEFLESSIGLALSKQQRARLLDEAGLPRDAKLADFGVPVADTEPHDEPEREEPEPPKPFMAPRVEIDLIMNGERVLLEPGMVDVEASTPDRVVYRRPVQHDNLGSGEIQVVVFPLQEI